MYCIYRAILEVIERNRAEGFAELVGIDKNADQQPKAKVGIFDFYRLPHPKNPGENVGSPFTKDYLELFGPINDGKDKPLLHATRYSEALMNYLHILKSTRFWTNYKQRVAEEISVWFDDEAKIGAIAPAIIPAGTVTRRSTHKLWVTSTSPKDGIIGTDLKSMIQVPNGWKMVGADVDSQEQWLACLLGDYITGKGKAGYTKFANMVLAGSKSDKSDLHSVVARQVGISRDNAKVLNYSRLYGAGKSHAFEFLKQQAIDSKRAQRFSEKLFSATKGVEKK